jgi:glycosyltransferase involved in cell wall biosynthesis
MRIAQVAPLFEAVPPAGYGGTERVVAALCDSLVELGHDVTLFAAGTSGTDAQLEPVVSAPLRQRMTRKEMVEVAPHLHLWMLADVFNRAGDFDVIHSHADLLSLPFTRYTATPTVVTLHGRLDLDVVRRTVRLYPGTPFVSISDSQRLPLTDLDVNWAGTVHNGLDLTRYRTVPRRSGDYLGFVGRISPEKGPELAVEIARRTGWPLRVAAKIDPVDMKYYRQTVEPLFERAGVRFVGELEEQAKPEFYAGAAATLFPSDWPEPFGLVMIESMAAGTPVIALRRGSVPEIVIDGVTGFICDDVEEMVAAVDRLDEIDPAACRRHAERFDAMTMAEGYEAVYRAVLESVGTAMV